MDNSLHHFLPQAYLRRFSPGGRIDVINRADGTIRQNQPINKVAAIKGLYNFNNADKTPNGSLEEIIAKELDEPGNRILDHMSSLFPYIPRGIDRELLARYIAFQYLRTPERIRSIELMGDFIGKAELSLKLDYDTKFEQNIKKILKEKHINKPTEEIAELMEWMKDYSKYEVVVNKNVILRQLLDMIPKLVFYLNKIYSWHIVRFDSDILITGDHPVILIPFKDRPRFMGTGFLNAYEIWFPISSKTVLIFNHNRYTEESITYGDTNIARLANDAIFSSSQLEVYSHPQLSHNFIGVALGERPVFHVDGGVFDFITDYSKAPARPRPQR